MVRLRDRTGVLVFCGMRSVPVVVTFFSLMLVPFVTGQAAAQPDQRVGPLQAEPGSTVVLTGQLVRPAGITVEFAGRPVDLAISPDGATVYAKDNRGLVVVDASAWTVRQELDFGDKGSSQTGLIVSPDGTRVWASDADRFVHEFEVSKTGVVSLGRRFKFAGPKGVNDASYPQGLALSPDGTRLWVCLSRNNAVACINLADGVIERTISTQVAPFDLVFSLDGTKAYVSCWGGKKPVEGDLTANSAGTRAKVDARGIAVSGGVSVLDLGAGTEAGYIETGLQASGLTLASSGTTLLVTNSNSDTLTVIETPTLKVLSQLVVRPDDKLPFGSMPTAVTVPRDGKIAYVACPGNNAIAVVDLFPSFDKPPTSTTSPTVLGWIPTGWYPGAVEARGGNLYVANIRGVGSRTARKDGSFNSHKHRGSLQRVAIPDAETLATMTATVKADSRVPQMLLARERSTRAAEIKPVPIPAHPGDPSTIEHVVYFIKENRTYDQVFGGLAGEATPKGRGKPELCIYGRDVTPNHHGLAETYVLLDNWYCNGVLSADGHSWATEGNSTPYLERSFGGFTRSYTFGDDPLTYSSSGFIWDHVLAAGLTFRNFGEFDEAKVVAPKGKSDQWASVWDDWKSGRREYKFEHSIGIDNLRRHSDPDFPGWNMQIPDQIRADIFIGKLAEMEKAGEMPNLIVIHLPQDHTMGVGENDPTPRACVADNDLALGRIVEALSRSKFWPKMAVFSTEDDPQDGWDHVDGHRSVCVIASPWAKRGEVVSRFYNQASVLHTMGRILGIPVMNQATAAAPLMTECFTATPDFSAYVALTPRVAIDELTPQKPPKPKPGDGQAPPSQKATPPAAAPGEVPKLSLADLYDLTAKQDLRKPDRVDDHEFNLILWHAAKGMDVPYPIEFAGAHGKGLADLGLAPDPDVDEDEDEDEDGD
jgi:YVTN family beta-propeller protein